ncbi:MAG: pyridoxamine 5'-phosphate oxidase family protein [Gemmatimonadales bacterium]|jgi:hypothetical protein
MTREDEPLFLETHPAASDTPADDPRLADRIRDLVEGQRYGVLCTQGHEQPYGSLIAFAFADDLSFAVFATPLATRKYRLLSECGHVALVVDSRPDHPDDMMKVEALTATGEAVEVARGATFDEYARLLTGRHPQLEAFVHAPSCALFRINVVRFFHVTRFQEVGQWVPPSR